MLGLGGGVGSGLRSKFSRAKDKYYDNETPVRAPEMVQDAEMDSVRARFPPIHLVRLGQEMMTFRIGLVGFSTQEETMVGGFNEKYNVLVDERGIMLPASEIDDLQASLIAHKAHSQSELETIGKKVIEERHPSMASQFNYDLEGTRSISDTLAQSLAGLEKGSALLRSTDAISEGNTVHGVIKISMARYNAWLTEVQSRGQRRNTASPETRAPSSVTEHSNQLKGRITEPL